MNLDDIVESRMTLTAYTITRVIISIHIITKVKVIVIKGTNLLILVERDLLVLSKIFQQQRRKEEEKDVERRRISLLVS